MQIRKCLAARNSRTFFVFRPCPGSGFPAPRITRGERSAGGRGNFFIAPLLTCPVFLLESVNFLLSLWVIALPLAMILKYIPAAKITWSDIWMGAAVASLLLTTAKALMVLYLTRSTVASAYGAASSLVIILTWVYYSAQIVFFGAEVTQVYSRQHASQM